MTVRRIRKRSGGSFPRRTISMYARGLSVREIQGHLAELYGLDVSPELVSAVTDAILEDIAEWWVSRDRGRRPRKLGETTLEAVYPLIFFDALRIKVRDEGTVRNKAVYLALGVRACGSPWRSSASGSNRPPPRACCARSLRESDRPSADGRWAPSSGSG